MESRWAAELFWGNTTNIYWQVYSVTTTLSYRAKLSDSGSRVECQVELADDLKNEVSLSASQALTVSPADSAGGGAGGLTDWQIALSVILPCLLIACLAALILGLFYHRRRRQTQSTPPITDTDQKSRLPYTDIDFNEPPPSSNTVVITEETDTEEDVVRVFTEEGDQDSLASLSSLSSLVTQSDTQSIGEIIAGLGDKFQGLAKIYKEDEEDSELDNRIYNGTVPRYLGHESWV